MVSSATTTAGATLTVSNAQADSRETHPLGKGRHERENCGAGLRHAIVIAPMPTYAGPALACQMTPSPGQPPGLPAPPGCLPSLPLWVGCCELPTTDGSSSPRYVLGDRGGRSCFGPPLSETAAEVAACTVQPDSNHVGRQTEDLANLSWR